MTTKTNAQAKAPEILGDAEFNKKWDLEGQYSVLRKSNDPRFGEITLLKNKSSNDLIFAKEKLVTSKQQASNDIRDLKSRIALNHKNLHRLLGYSTAVQKELCSTNYLTKAYYEFPKSDLQKEVNDKNQSGADFSGADLFIIGGQSIHGLNHLHKLEISHGDVRPLNIGYNRDSKEVQILDRLNDPSPLEKLQTNNIINKKELYISPEVYKKLQGKDKTLKYDPFKNDLYSLGLTLLASGNKESIQDVYKPNGDFDHDKLNAHLQKFDSRYSNESPEVTRLVHNLLNPDESKRFTAQELLQNQNQNQGILYTHHTVQSTPPQVVQTHVVQHAVHAETPVDTGDDNDKRIYYVQDQTESEPVSLQHQTYHYVNSAPVTTYSQPVTTYSQPVTTYAQQAPVSYTTHHSYVQSTPVTFTSFSQPEEFTQNPPTSYVADSNYKPQSGRLVTVQKLDGSTYTYTTKSDIELNDTVHTYEQNDPRGNQNSDYQSNTNQHVVQSNVVYATPDSYNTTHVARVSHKVESSPTYTYVSSTPTYNVSSTNYTSSYIPSNNVQTVYAPSDQTYTYAQPVVRTSHYVQGGTYTTVTPQSPVSYVNVSSDPSNQPTYQIINGVPVEVRRGSNVPIQSVTTSVKKKYIVEGDKVIEVDADEQE